MPIYEFECPDCEVRFESLSPLGTETAPCPDCGRDDCGRVMSQINPITRQPTPGQKRRMEDKRGIDRDGARTRWKQTMSKARERKKGS